MYSGLYSIHSQSLHGRDSSECSERTKQPTRTEKSSRTTLHYIIQNGSARDLVLPTLRISRLFILRQVWVLVCTRQLLCTLFLSPQLDRRDTEQSLVRKYTSLFVCRLQTFHYGMRLHCMCKAACGSILAFTLQQGRIELPKVVRGHAAFVQGKHWVLLNIQFNFYWNKHVSSRQVCICGHLQ